jgi:biotin carboxylase
MGIDERDGPVLLVGFVGGLLPALATFMPERSVIFIDEPDVIRKRDARTLTAGAPTLRDIIEWECELDGSADSFFHHHRNLNPSAVVPISDYSVPFAARLAERYGLPGAGYGAAILLRDKQLQRLVTAAAGIANPQSVPVHGPAEVEAFMKELGGPVVLKPANRRAAIGTKIIYDPAEIETCWLECTHHDEGIFVSDRPMPLRMLAERFVSGDEFSVEMLLRDGKPVFGGVTRKYLFEGARPIELGHLHPADIDAELTERLLTETVRVADAVGMATGIVHCEWMVSNGVAHLIECGGRMAGDGIIELVMVAWEYDIVEQYINVMRGLPTTAEPPPVAPKYSAVWLPHAPVGRVERVEGVDRARTSPGVHTCAIHLEPGDEVHELRSSWDRIALITTEGATADEALANARNAADAIKVTVVAQP